VPIYLRCL